MAPRRKKDRGSVPTGDELLLSVRPGGGSPGMASDSPAFLEEMPERLTTGEDVEDFLFTLGKAVIDGSIGPETAKAAAPFMLKRADLAINRIRRKQDAEEAARQGTQHQLPPSPLTLQRSVTVTETLSLPERDRVPALPPDPRKLRQRQQTIEAQEDPEDPSA